MPLTRRAIVPAVVLTAAVLVELALVEPVAGSALAAMTLLALAVRRSRPVAAVTVPAAAIAIDAAAGGVLVAGLGSTLVVMGLACFALGYHAAGPWRAACGAAAVVAAMTVANQLDPANGYPALDDLVFFGLLLGAPTVLGQLLRRRAALIAELAARADALSEARAEQAAAAVAEERARLAIGVHDALAHRVGEISLQAAGAGRVAGDDPDRALTALRSIEGTARAALDDIRGVIGVLRHGDEEIALAPARAPGTAVPPPWAGAKRAAGLPPAGRRTGALDRYGDALLAAAFFVALTVETLTSSQLAGPAWANVAAAALIAAPLALRRRAPLVSAAAACAALAAFHALPLTPPAELVTPIALLLVLPYSLAAHLPRRIALAALAVGAAATLAVAPTLATAAILLASFAAGLAARDRARRVEQLRRLNEELRRTGDAHAALARGEERLRVARELHDAVAHSMTVIVLQAGAAQRIWDRDPAAAQAAIGALAGEARATLAELRETLRGEPPPRLGALEEIAARVRPLGVDVEITGAEELLGAPPGVEQAAHAVVQEALTNAVRYAAPTTARVRLHRSGDDLVVEVTDAGRAAGAVPHATVTGTGSGLLGLGERVAALGGELQHGLAGPGFRVAARLPLVEVAVAWPSAC